MSMPSPIRPPTIEDVARQAGVSIATVSRVLNNSAVVASEKAERIRSVIAQLNYAPRAAARGLAKRRTDTIGLLLPEISGAFFPPMLRGIEAGATQAGYNLLIHTTNNLSSRPSTFTLIGEQNTDGLLVFTHSLADAEIVRLYRQGFPLVLLHQTAPEGLNIPVVTIENKDGAFQLVQHLIEVHGRRRIVFLSGPEDHEDSHWRERGYRQVLQNFGLAFDPGLVAYGGFDQEDACAAISSLLERAVAFDAVFSGDDDAAVGVLEALHKAGKRVPEDVAVVGFDDVPFAPFLNPPLTTVHVPIEEVGCLAVQQMVRLLRGEQADPLVLMPTKIILRQSCGCTKII